MKISQSKSVIWATGAGLITISLKGFKLASIGLLKYCWASIMTLPQISGRLLAWCLNWLLAIFCLNRGKVPNTRKLTINSLR